MPSWSFVAVVVLGAVLRFWQLGHATLSADESYSAVVSRMSFGQIWGFVDRTDPHPPFSYFLLGPFTHLASSTFMVRFPAATCAVLALGLLAWWQRHRGIAGLTATFVFAVSPFLLDFGRQARMYGLLTLLGVALAMSVDRWLCDGDRRWAVLAGVVAFLMAMSYTAGFLMPFVLGAVPLLRRDRKAWELRIAAGVAALGWLVLWAGHTLHWSKVPTYYPALSLSWVTNIVNDTVAPVPSDRWFVLGLMVVGLVIVLRRPGPTRHLVTSLWLVPMAVLLVASLHNDIFIPKTMTMFAWAPALLLGAVAGEAWRIRPLLAGAVVAVLVIVTVPYISTTLSYDEHAGVMLAALEAARQPGDGFGMNPARLGTLLEWYEGVVPGHTIVADTRVIPGSVVYRRADEPFSGRVWLVESIDRSTRDHVPVGARSCGDDRVVGGGYRMRCVDLTGISS